MFELIATFLAWLYSVTNSYAIAIILLTVVVRIVLFPLTLKQTKSMQGMQLLAPEMKKLQEQHKDDRAKLNEEVAKLYREHKINPLGCSVPMLLQAPIFFGMYRVVNGLTQTSELSGLMIRVSTPKYLSKDNPLYQKLVDSAGAMRSFGIDLAQSAQSVAGSGSGRLDSAGKALPYVLLVMMVGVTGYLQQEIMNRQQGPATTPQAAQMQKAMKFLPVFFAFISYNIQAAVVLYWIVGNIWMMLQSQVVRRIYPPVIPAVAGAPVVSSAAAAAVSKSTGKAGSGKAGSVTAAVKDVHDKAENAAAAVKSKREALSAGSSTGPSGGPAVGRAGAKTSPGLRPPQPQKNKAVTSNRPNTNKKPR
jgi:YidC/Oxa1 family membrane protein insertase